MNPNLSDDVGFAITPVAEFKFAGDAAGLGLGVGEFTGYGAVFGNTDSHGDVIAPGAFAGSLARHKAEGRRIPMHVMHSVFGGDGCPVGVWKAVSEDDTGLRVHGKISGMGTDAGKLTFERLKDGAYGGLSIGYSVAPGGAVKGQQPGEPRRLLKAIDLREISLVDSPSNAQARVDEMKRSLMRFASDVKLTSRGDLEELLRNAGLPRAAARKIAAGGWPALAEDDEPDVDLSPIIRSIQSFAK